MGMDRIEVGEVFEAVVEMVEVIRVGSRVEVIPVVSRAGVEEIGEVVVLHRDVLNVVRQVTL